MLQIFSSIIRWAARSFTILIVAVFLAFAAGEPAGSFGRNSLSRLGGYAAFVRSYHRNVVGLEVGASVGVNIAVRAGCICWGCPHAELRGPGLCSPSQCFIPSGLEAPALPFHPDSQRPVIFLYSPTNRASKRPTYRASPQQHR